MAAFSFEAPLRHTRRGERVARQHRQAEHQASNLRVGGSNPSRRASKIKHLDALELEHWVFGLRVCGHVTSDARESAVSSSPRDAAAHRPPEHAGHKRSHAVPVDRWCGSQPGLGNRSVSVSGSGSPSPRRTSSSQFARFDCSPQGGNSRGHGPGLHSRSRGLRRFQLTRQLTLREAGPASRLPGKVYLEHETASTNLSIHEREPAFA